MKKSKTFIAPSHHRTSLFLYLLIGCMGVGILSSCQKDDPVIASSSLESRDGSSGDTVILGSVQNNPYSVTRLNSAKATVYNVVITAANRINPTYKCIRFRPTSAEQVVALGGLSYPVFDFPLDRPIISMGNTPYHNPEVPAGHWDYLYATVPISDPIPAGIDYDILDEVNYSVKDSSIIKMAFLNAGYGPGSAEYEALDFADDDYGDGYGNNGDSGDSGSSSELVWLADCSCKQGTVRRQPAGCIRVWDTQKDAYMAARHVRIIMLGPFGAWISTETDDAGCYTHPSRLFFRWFAYIEMHNQKTDIYDLRSKAIALIGNIVSGRVLLPFKYFFKGFNGIEANQTDHDFELERNESLERFSAWKALTINNGVHELHQFCSRNSLMTPPNHLRIMSHDYSNDGACTMLNRITAEDGILPLLNLGDDVFWYLSENNTAWQTTPHPPNVQLIITSLAPIAMWLMPDVVIGRQNTIIINEDRLATDQVKHLTYHELAHAIHFQQVGKDYWIDEIEYTLANDGYGNGTADDAGRPAIVESWANFIGPTVADAAYHDDSSPYHYQQNGVVFTQSHAPIQSSFLQAMEAFDPALPNDPFNWMPRGIMHDLRDDNPASHENLNNPVTDNVTGYTIPQLFSALQNDVASPIQYKDKLLQQNSNNQQSDVNTLFKSYGY